MRFAVKLYKVEKLVKYRSKEKNKGSKKTHNTSCFML